MVGGQHRPGGGPFLPGMYPEAAPPPAFPVTATAPRIIARVAQRFHQPPVSARGAGRGAPTTESEGKPHTRSTTAARHGCPHVDLAPEVEATLTSAHKQTFNDHHETVSHALPDHGPRDPRPQVQPMPAHANANK